MQQIVPFMADLAIPADAVVAEVASCPAAAAFSRTTIDVKTGDHEGSDD